MKKGKLIAIGFGPGHELHMTQRARDAFAECDIIIGYKTYVELIRHLLTPDQKIVSTGMTEEVGRAQEAVKLAEAGHTVAVISSGDAGVYGMAGLIYEVLVEQGWNEETGVELEVVPGVSAIQACASLLGAPVMHDSCTISLSDHLTPWEWIKKRVEAAAMADFVIALYNPKSGRRTRQIEETQKILLQYRSPQTPVGLVKSAYRERQDIVITDLEHMLEHDIGMLTTVIIGNSTTFLYDGKIITPRGYQRKYTLGEEKQPLKPHQRLKEENEPWALHGGEKEEAPILEEKKTEIIQTEPEINNVLELAEQALAQLDGTTPDKVSSLFQEHRLFEFTVSPGVANKKMSPSQLTALAAIVGEAGEIEYTPDHEFKISLQTENPEEITSKLKKEGWLLAPAGNVVKVKACDFCDGDKQDPIPYAVELRDKLGGLSVPKELKIGFNGCGMACYGAVAEDIGIVYRRKKFDVFLGAKAMGRNAHTGVPVVEGLEPEKLVPLIVAIVEQFRNEGLPNERFYKFFKRVQNIQGYPYQEVPTLVVLEPDLC
ncbi:precorrin-3B C(17)-methyltransferase [Sporosarcina sp. 179-K 3D1 HS]|uniref:precorrin-3B C(17)-methyltransferase n=1 Tax=Sporosarcina sp. 179-K 3D1 HS TaxID=3232169 RepID=UPI0039A2BA24